MHLYCLDCVWFKYAFHPQETNGKDLGPRKARRESRDNTTPTKGTKKQSTKASGLTTMGEGVLLSLEGERDIVRRGGSIVHHHC